MTMTSTFGISTLQHKINSSRPLLSRGTAYSSVICNFWHPGTLTLSAERQSARMSKVTTSDCVTRSGTDRMLYSCTHTTTVDVKGFKQMVIKRVGGFQADIGPEIGDWEPDDAWPYGSVTSFNPYHCDLAALEVCLLAECCLQDNSFSFFYSFLCIFVSGFSLCFFVILLVNNVPPCSCIWIYTLGYFLLQTSKAVTVKLCKIYRYIRNC